MGRRGVSVCGLLIVTQSASAFLAAAPRLSPPVSRLALRWGASVPTSRPEAGLFLSRGGLCVSCGEHRLRRAPLSVFAQLGGMRGGMMAGLFGGALAGLAGGASNNDDPAAPFTDTAGSWEEIAAKLEGMQTPEERAFRQELASGRGPTCSMAALRLFDAPEGTEPKVTLYRDKAAWCPYCEKVWIQLEEKRIPYKVEKINMSCYGSKPDWFMKMQPSGGIPVARVNGRVITESNDIMQALEDEFPDHPKMFPPKGDPQAPRVQPLLRLEREIFSSWFRWMGSGSRFGDSQMQNFETIMTRVDSELAQAKDMQKASGGEGLGFFLGDKVSIVDCMFAPFLERIAASVPYYKGLVVRGNPKWPHVTQWFTAMEARESFRGIQSDYYTHAHDLPPQIGGCRPHAEAEVYRAEIDGEGSAWRLPLEKGVEPVHGAPKDDGAARREAAERVINYSKGLVPFMLRAVGTPGRPVGAGPLSDPNATPDLRFEKQVDAALRHTAEALLGNGDNVCPKLSPGLPAHTVKLSLAYLRDRISVPRDMSFAAARQLRAHLNLVIDGL